MNKNRFMRTAVPLLTAGTVVLFLLCGCATSIETPLRKPHPYLEPQPFRVGVLPPRIHPDIEKDNLKAEEPLYKQLMDGRGVVVTSSSPSEDIGLEIVSTLTQANKYQRIFTVENEEDARQHGADSLLTVTVWDYRAIQLGSNKKYPLMALLGPLMSQYWIRWRTIEASFEWEVKLTSTADGSTLYRNRLKRAYTSPVRSASGHYFTDKMMSFLQNQAAPDYIGDLFELDMVTPQPMKDEPIFSGFMKNHH
ncbi:MAG: hypothetical protein IT583_00765 [Verrucomicrobia bacterium]|nr:hypothetical protein [Verrucomicrobiota bacterium]